LKLGYIRRSCALLLQLLKATLCSSFFIDVAKHIANLKLEVVLGQENNFSLLVLSVLLSNASNR
jgi:hypothetical protein